MDIVLGLDVDPNAARTFQVNFPEADFMNQDIRSIQTQALQPFLERAADDHLLFSCCAPCQPFSQQNKAYRADDDRLSLIQEFGRFVQHYQPTFIFIENVPNIRDRLLADGTQPFDLFFELLRTLRYVSICRVVLAQDYGVPQRRRRMVLIASLLPGLQFPEATYGPGTANPDYTTVRDWIADLPPIEAGQTHPNIPNHQAAMLSDLNLRRIRGTPIGGGRLDWPEELRLECHTGDYQGHSDVYGRMRWDAPASALTTRCTSLSNGRFGHPEQNRAISVREAASLQTFPREFVFHGNLHSLARQVGNAVPPRMAQCFAGAFLQNLNPDTPRLVPNG